MKVICIDDSGRNGNTHPFLMKGKIYEPIGEQLDYDGIDCYELSGFPNSLCIISMKFNNKPLYRKTRFIPLQDFKQTTFKEINEAVPCCDN
jgi:hypothetical protein